VQRLKEAGHDAKRDAGAGYGHHRKHARVEEAGPSVKAQAEILRNRARPGAVEERHHVERGEQKSRSGAERKEQRRLEAEARSRGARGDDFLRPQACNDECRGAYPRGQNAACLEKVFGRLDGRANGEADGDYADQEEKNNQPVDGGEVGQRRLRVVVKLLNPIYRALRTGVHGVAIE